VFKNNEKDTQRIVILALITISVLSTFHAAMRTFVTPLFMILGVLKIKS